MSAGPDINGSDVAELETSLGHVFDDKSLLLAALTHPSLAGLKGGRGLGTYERLEFLGDRVLAAVGYVPEQNLIGRAEFLFFSTDHRAELWEVHRWADSIRFSRFFKSIQ